MRPSFAISLLVVLVVLSAGCQKSGPANRASTNALNFHKPDAICSVLASTDLAKFVREGNKRNFFEGKSVVAFWAGGAENFNPAKNDIPAGWLVSGYASEYIREPAHQAWIAAYRKRYGTLPYGGSLSGYIGYHFMAQILNRAGSTDPAKIIAAAEGFTLDSFVGPIHLRAADHQSTAGTWISRTARTSESEPATLVDCEYKDGADYLPSEAEAAKLRPESRSSYQQK